MGAFAHAPRHSTSRSVNSPSAVVSPSLMPRWFSMAFLMASDPHTMHGVVPHNWMKYLPTGVLLNMV